MEFSDKALENVFSFLSTKVLLSSCRLVNKQWSLKASLICRQRHLHFKFPTQERLQKFDKTVQNSHVLPWSSFSIARSGIAVFVDYTKDIPILLKFISKFGHCVLKVEFEGYNYQFLLNVLKFTPNIESIQFKLLENHKEQTDKSGLVFPGSTFSKLKSLLDFEINGSCSFSVFEFITANGPRLAKLSLSINLGAIKYTPQIAPIIQKISTISLKIQQLPPAAYTPFATGQPIRVQELSFDVPSPGDTKKEKFYDPIEKFLLSISSFLKKLSLVHGRVNAEPIVITRLEIPTLPALKYLEVVDDAGTGRGTDYCPPLSFVKSPFTSTQFPLLEKFSFSSFGGTLQQFNSVSFMTIKELNLNSKAGNPVHFLQNNWASIFPCLKTLKCHVNENGLYYIFREMKKLEELEVKINLKVFDTEKMSSVLPDDADINSILSGYENHQALFMASKNKGEEAVFEEIPTLCLAQMKDLQVLSLDLMDCGHLQDSGIFLSLLQMQPLQKLSIQNGKISEESRKRLQAYHVKFQCVETS